MTARCFGAVRWRLSDVCCECDSFNIICVGAVRIATKSIGIGVVFSELSRGSGC
jgi:hypothetical protein